MAGFLEGFSKTARLAYPIIQRGVREALSGNRIIGVLQSAALTFRRQSMLNLIRLERGLQTSFNHLKNIRPGFKPQIGSLRIAAGKIRRPFAFTVELRGRDLVTGLLDTRHVTVSTSELMTRAELEESALGTMNEETYREEFEPETSMLISGVKQGALGTL